MNSLYRASRLQSRIGHFAIEPTASPDDSWRLPVFLFIVSCLGNILISNHLSAGLPVLFIPLLLFTAADWRIILLLVVAFVLKSLFQFLLPLPDGYEFYEFNVLYAFRETVSTLLFFVWIIAGVRIFNFGLIRRVSFAAILTIVIAVWLGRVLFQQRVFFSGVDSSQMIAVTLLFLVVVDYRYTTLQATIAVGLMSVLAAGLASSFTTFTTLIIVIVYCCRLTRFGDRLLPWRLLFVGLLATLMFASLIASMVVLKSVDENGRGNNGRTREQFAQTAIDLFTTNVLSGTPLGRGIVPYTTVVQFGWTQYLDQATDDFDIYALSFHNGFLYLLSRYGVWSIAIFIIFILFVPQRGPLSFVLFSTVPLLAIAANVVIESVRAGPGVGFMLGFLFSIMQLNSQPRSMDRALFTALGRPASRSRLARIARRIDEYPRG